MSTHLVFVYGSLKTGFHNHRLLIDHGAAPLGVATTDERYLLLRGMAFPFLINPDHLSKRHARRALGTLLGNVSGELYRVDDDCLARLDLLESHPRFYRREVIGVNDGVKAWAYFLNRPSERVHINARDAAKPDDDGIVEWKREDVFADEEG